MLWVNFRAMLLLLLPLAYSACTIVNYAPKPIEPASAPDTKEGIIRFFFYSGAVGDPKAKENPLPIEASILQKVLETKAGFAAAVISNPPPAKGLHLSIYVTSKESSPLSRGFCTLSLLTLTAIPCYSDTGGYLVQYDLRIDDELKKTYRYEINKTLIQWIGVLPFVWVDSFTTHYTQAFEATAYQFLHNSRTDGYLQFYSPK
jgi:hypothetical protein